MRSTKLDLNTMEEYVANIARKYSRNIRTEFEDLYQELWLFLLEKDFDNPAIAVRSLVNRAIDISRKDWRDNNPLRSFDMKDPIADVFIESNKVSQSQESITDRIELLEILDILPKRERTYVIVKGYLNEGLIEFEEEFSTIFNSLDDDQKDEIRDYKRGLYTDDIILKVFLGIKSGTNSGSIRSIKFNLRSIFSK